MLHWYIIIFSVGYITRHQNVIFSTATIPNQNFEHFLRGIEKKKAKKSLNFISIHNLVERETGLKIRLCFYSLFANTLFKKKKQNFLIHVYHVLSYYLSWTSRILLILRKLFIYLYLLNISLILFHFFQFYHDF